MVIGIHIIIVNYFYYITKCIMAHTLIVYIKWIF